MRVDRLVVCAIAGVLAVGCRIGFDRLGVDDAGSADDAAATVDAPASGAPGSLCTASQQCDTGVCADGRCCQTTCDAPCTACSAAGVCEEAFGTMVVTELPDRSGAVRLDGTVLPDVAFVMVQQCDDLTSVAFRVDSLGAEPVNVEVNEEWDLVGTSQAEEPRPLLAGMLPPGERLLLASCETTDGRTQVIGARVTAPDVAAGLRVSSDPTRAGAVPLSGETLAGDVYIFYVAPDAPFDRDVAFYIDDPLAEGSPATEEQSAPFDLEGGESLANPFDTTALANGTHTLTVVADDLQGGVAMTTARFDVANP